LIIVDYELGRRRNGLTRQNEAFFHFPRLKRVIAGHDGGAFDDSRTAGATHAAPARKGDTDARCNGRVDNMAAGRNTKMMTHTVQNRGDFGRRR
jgi:hypothetical protein